MTADLQNLPHNTKVIENLCRSDGRDYDRLVCALSAVPSKACDGIVAEARSQHMSLVTRNPTPLVGAEIGVDHAALLIDTCAADEALPQDRKQPLDSPMSVHHH
jgi:hypothetical protein